MAISRKNKKITKNNKKIKVKTNLKRRINKKTRYVRKMKGGTPEPGDWNYSNNENNTNTSEQGATAGPATTTHVKETIVENERNTNTSEQGATAGPATTNVKETLVENEHTIKVKHPEQHHGDLPGAKTTMSTRSSHTQVTKVKHKILQAKNIIYNLNEVVDTVIRIIKENDTPMTQWKREYFNTVRKKNVVLNNLPLLMRYENYSISNSHRNKTIKDLFNDESIYNKRADDKGIKKEIMIEGINLLDKMYNLIVYIIATNKNKYHEDVDKMIALLSLLLQSRDNYYRHARIKEYLATQTLPK